MIFMFITRGLSPSSMKMATLEYFGPRKWLEIAIPVCMHGGSITQGYNGSNYITADITLAR